MSEKSRLAAFLFCWFLGLFGVHRFYVGKIGTGIIWLLTLGCVGIGVLVDLINLLLGNFTDVEKKPVKVWFKICDAEGKIVNYAI